MHPTQHLVSCHAMRDVHAYIACDMSRQAQAPTLVWLLVAVPIGYKEPALLWMERSTS